MCSPSWLTFHTVFASSHQEEEQKKMISSCLSVNNVILRSQGFDLFLIVVGENV